MRRVEWAVGGLVTLLVIIIVFLVITPPPPAHVVAPPPPCGGRLPVQAPLPLPAVCQRVIINVGCWRDPVVSDDPHTCTLAVEALPRTAQAIVPLPRLLVIVAAVSDTVGLAPFFAYGDGLPGSSSLSTAQNAMDGWVAVDPDVAPVTYVPLITLRMLLDAVPANVSIVLLKTDAQGWDDRVLRSAGAAIARVMSVQCEVMCPDRNTQYNGPPNTWERVDAYLTAYGFTDTGGDKCVEGTAQSYHDAFFTRTDCAGPYCTRDSVEIHTF